MNSHPPISVSAAYPVVTGDLRRSQDLHLEVFNSFEVAEAVAPQWGRLIEQLHGSLYMTFGWCRVWWRHYGRGRALRLCLVRAGGELVGVLPFFIDRLRGPLGVTRVAKLVGSDCTLALVEAPVAADVAEQSYALAFRQLMCHDTVDMVHVGPSPATGAQLPAIRSAAVSCSRFALTLRDQDAGSHTVFELPDGFDAYLKDVSRNGRTNYRRNLNKLNKAFDFEVDVVRDGSELECEFDAFIAMHQVQWRAINKLGHFDDWPGSREFSRDLVRTLAAEGRVRLIRLVADGEPVAYYWCFGMDGTFYWRLSGRRRGERWDQFALGRVGLMKMLETAAAEGATKVEAGTGRYEYKEKLNASTLPLRSFALCASRRTSRLKARLELAQGDALDLAFYKLWFLRIAPRARGLRGPLMPRFDGPLRCSWMRRRF